MLKAGFTKSGLKLLLALCAQVASVRKLDTRHCAFVTFEDRPSAEKAAEGLSGRLFIQVPSCFTHCNDTILTCLYYSRHRSHWRSILCNCVIRLHVPMLWTT